MVITSCTYPPPRVAFLRLPSVGDTVSHCLLDYIYGKDEVPSYLIFAKKYYVECHVTGKDGHTSKEEGWAAHYDGNCDY